MAATRNLTYLIATSMDGFVAAPDGDTSMFDADQAYLDLLIRTWPETLPAPALEEFGLAPSKGVFETVIMGWTTYAVGYDIGLIDPYPGLDTYVCTRRHLGADVGSRVTLTDTDPVELIRSLKSVQTATGDIWLCGGPELAGVLRDEIDRVILKVNPVALGDGIPLFGTGTAALTRFQIESSRTVGRSVAIQQFERVP